MDIGLCSNLGMGSPGLVFWQRGQRLCSNLGMGSPAPACLLVAWARNGYVDVPYPSPNKKQKKSCPHGRETAAHRVRLLGYCIHQAIAICKGILLF